MSDIILTPEQRRQLSVFVREYVLAREYAAAAPEQAQAAVREANAVRDKAAERLRRAGEIALGGRTDLRVDFDTWEVVQSDEVEKVAESEESL